MIHFYPSLQFYGKFLRARVPFIYLVQVITPLQATDWGADKAGLVCYLSLYNASQIFARADKSRCSLFEIKERSFFAPRDLLNEQKT